MIAKPQQNSALYNATTLLTEQRRLAGLFALEVMHEVRNPLEALSNLTYLAHEEAEDAAKVRWYMRLAEEQVATLSKIVSDSLGLARSSRASNPVDLVGLAEAALRLHRNVVETKRIHLKRDLPKSLLANVHSGQMLQVVSNLIVNALEALPEDGTLSLRLRKRQDGIHFLVADNGHGIAPENLEKMFEPFFTTKGNLGNGLGLVLSKRIIEDHQGRIRLRSCVRAGRNGTAFKVFLPVVDGPGV